MHTGSSPLYRHGGAALLRAAAAPLDGLGGDWPDPTEPLSCRAWLARVWRRPEFVEAVRVASPGLVERVNGLDSLSDKQILRACMSVLRYALRASSRHTPFGMFAGVAPAAVATGAKVRWGAGHRPVARVDAQWLAKVIDGLERDAALLTRLEVVFGTLAMVRGPRMEAPAGNSTVSVRHTRAVAAVHAAAATPTRFADLATALAETFPAADPAAVAAMLTELVRQRFLITSLRAPLTVTDPLGHLLDRLHEAGAADLAEIAPIVGELRAVETNLFRHNHPATSAPERTGIRADLADRMRALADGARTPLAVDLRLDCDVRVPDHVAREMEAAATAMARLSGQPTGEPAWRDFHSAFYDRYGMGTLVPVADVVDPDTGIGYPAGYPGSVLPARTGTVSERDHALLALAWAALADGSDEVVLDDDVITSVAVGDRVAGEPRFAPHVEIAARIHATSADALDRGDCLLTVAPARGFGTFTSRFTTITPGSRLHEVYAAVPTSVDGALPVQLSFPPAYPHAENICRVPAYLPHVLSLGEHQGPDESVIPLEDLAVTATRDGLRLVSLSRQRVVEPQAFHGLALTKQTPPLARFLIHLARGLGASWHRFDWGPAAQRLPYLPRVRYRRSILAPARWRLTSAYLPADADLGEFAAALQKWRARSRCPAVVELVDADRTLRLDLDVPAHVAILRAHLARNDDATLTEAVADPAEYGWIGGHAHEIVLPLVSTQAPAPAPAPSAVSRPPLTSHGRLPAAPGTNWLNAKLHTHPQRLDELITEHVPRLLAGLDNPAWWFIRYRSATETDHLRLRLPTPDTETYAATLLAVGAWADQLRTEKVIGRLVIDTYYPEVGRYGHGQALAAAEAAFVADSAAVTTQLRRLPEPVLARDALVALNMAATVAGLLGDTAAAMRWLTARPAPPGPATDRAVLAQLTTLLDDATTVPAGWDGDLAATWQARAAALDTCRHHLATSTDLDVAAEALLHMHHNRAIGIDRDRENRCRRLARHAALAWIARHREEG
ncbi:lantibiotic dehydratase [Actinokineospora xionganensis]|uniref:Lantibiotic dehydratase n=1 Tax=Actinokineospora xionganensis TaxID=2684470 RepID=A0ABR7LE13_9PSEU|nr:lantibiotic dehydratase [Actinokineospora xionganensis]MBC6450909.1 lantibiotic dehydratase [Actinokineospora xionganensis]